jgi:hypothetical protein
MKPTYNINWQAAPKDWKKFERWHKLACEHDPLTAKERFVKEGGKIDNPGIKGEK